jgi:hypothetical protein
MTTASLPVDSATESAADPAALRLARLRESVRGLGGSWRLAENLEQLLLIVGGILIPLGVAFVVAGWWGAAHTPRLFEQIPYAISGGILGGSLVIAGGFLYFGYWLTRLVHEGRQQTALITAAVRQLEARLGADVEALTLEAQDAPPATPRRRAPASATVAAAESAKARTFLATPTGSMFHRADCPVVLGKEGLRRIPPDAAGFKPCRICDPLG